MTLRLSNAVSVFMIITCFYIGNVKANDLNLELSKIANTADEIALNYHQQGWFSGTLLLANNGNVFHTSSYGLENVKTKIPNTIATKYNLGSIVKNFTKVLVLQQIEVGRLHLTDTLESFDLGFPEEISSKITIEHLLNHRSGFEDIFIAQYRENQLAFDTLEKKLALLKNRPLLFKPGTEQRYSNYGYVVLGAILEKVTHSSYEQLLNKNIFKRLNFQNTTLKVDSFEQGQSTRYAYLYDSSLKKVGVTEHPGPAGGVESTVEDVQKFYRELFYGNKLLSQANMLNKESFAMGGEHWGAYGGGAGVSAAVEVDLANNIEIVVLANTDNLVAELISGRVLSYIKKGSYEPIKQLEMNFAYNYYKEKGKDKFYLSFKDEYKKAGYSLFIGRTINELGMQLVESKSWNEAFDIINYISLLFPNAPQGYDSLAFAHYKKGELKKARTIFQKAEKLQPNFKSDYISNNYEK